MVHPSRSGKSVVTAWASGFTLTELMTATLITSTVIAIAGTGLVNILNANQRVKAQESRRAEINRAIELIADDIKDARLILTTRPTKSNYQGVFQFTKADGTTVSYFTRAKSRSIQWQGPLIIYRQESTQKKAFALVDAIADTTPSCTGNGTPLGGAGFQVIVAGNKKYIEGNEVFVDAKAKICLLGYLDASTTLPIETQVFARNQ